MHYERQNNRLKTAITSVLAILLITTTLISKSQIPQQIHNKMSLPETAYNIKFKWQGDSVNNSFEKHSAILVPVKLVGCPKTFYMQFDLGSPYTLFYKKKMETIKARFPQTQLTMAATNSATLTFKLDKTEIAAAAIVVRDFGNATVDFDAQIPQIIGTVGVDLFDGKVLVINYPKQKLTISQEKPSIVNKEQVYTPFTYMQRSVILPAVLKGKKTMLFFDTGSSRYALLTDERTAKMLGIKNELPITSKVTSWDRILTANTISTDATLTVAGCELPIQKVTYMEGASSGQVNMMMKMGIGGMTGNKLFLNYKLVLDTKNKEFALIK